MLMDYQHLIAQLGFNLKNKLKKYMIDVEEYKIKIKKEKT